jgi:hypothetical protein
MNVGRPPLPLSLGYNTDAAYHCLLFLYIFFPVALSYSAMEVESDPTKKISTSGPRNSRRETWRKARGWKPKKGTKNGGRPSRRK